MKTMRCCADKNHSQSKNHLNHVQDIKKPAPVLTGTGNYQSINSLLFYCFTNVYEAVTEGGLPATLKGIANETL